MLTNHTRIILLVVMLSFNLLMSTLAFADDKLVFAIDVIRHGDRTPAKELPKSEYHWPQGLGQLTEEGMLQEFNLGKKMRAKYVDQYQLLPPRYQHGTMYVRSTNMDRTLMSAESLLYGLYPLGVGASTMPSAFQPIPVHTIKKEEETVLIPDQDEKKFESLLHRYVYNQKEWQQKSTEFKKSNQEWVALTGLALHDLREIVSLADNLLIRELKGIPLPVGMTSATAHQIITTGEWAFAQTLKPYPVSRASAKELFQEIHVYLKNATAPDNPLKFVLYSAHDSTIMMIMSALHVPMDHAPRYASDWNLSLFETPSHEYYVKISLNDEPVIVPACQSDRCPLSKFMLLLQ